MYSRDDATILKSRKLQKFSAEKRRKKFNAGERKFERVPLKLRTSFPSLQALHLLPYVLLGDQPVVLAYPSASMMSSLPLWLSSFRSPPMIFKWNQLQMQSEPQLLMRRIPLYALTPTTIASIAHIMEISLLTIQMTLCPWHLYLIHPHLEDSTSRLELGPGGLALGLQCRP
jgi:hypothetical protein